MNRAGALALALVAIASTAFADDGVEVPAGDRPTTSDATVTVAAGELGDLLDRLRGHRVSIADDRRSLAIVDIAGEGPPWVGVVERRGDALWLITPRRSLRLAGALARPRVAGPGYTVWVGGRVDGDVLHVRRIGVLRRPLPRS